MCKKKDMGPVYKFLMRPHSKKQEIMRLEEIIKELRDCLLPGTAGTDSDNVQTSPKNHQEEMIIKIVSLEEDVKRLKGELADAILEVNAAVDRLNNPIERSVLTFYYINRIPPNDVASMIGYSPRSMYYIKKQAIAHLCSELQLLGVL